MREINNYQREIPALVKEMEQLTMLINLLNGWFLSENITIIRNNPSLLIDSYEDLQNMVLLLYRLSCEARNTMREMNQQNIVQCYEHVVNKQEAQA